MLRYLQTSVGIYSVDMLSLETIEHFAKSESSINSTEKKELLLNI